MHGANPSSTLNAGRGPTPLLGGLRSPALVRVETPDAFQLRGFAGGVRDLWAWTIAYLLLQYLPLRSFSWLGLIFKAVEYIGLTSGCGHCRIRTTCWFRGKPSSFGPAMLTRTVGAGWIFLPLVALLYEGPRPGCFPRWPLQRRLQR